MNLFSEWTSRGITSRNRIVVSPMCMYSSEDGFANDWHLVHLGSFARGGAGIVFTEATAVADIGRITPEDLGIYRDEHMAKLSQITGFIKSQGAIPAIQLAHAGRKASTVRPWDEGVMHSPDGRGWETIAPSPIPFSDTYPKPREMNQADIDTVKEQFAKGASRALEAGFEIIEIHGAHGYLINQFLSPLSNHRTDAYGGLLANRARLLIEVVDAVRKVWPAELPLFVRLSATEWVEGGLTVDDTVTIAKMLKLHGVDAIDASSGGNVPHAKIPVGPGYQTSAAAKIRAEAEIAVAAVGLITDARQAETILATGQADLVVLAREMLRSPHWPAKAARDLGITPPFTPAQYLRSW